MGCGTRCELRHPAHGVVSANTMMADQRRREMASAAECLSLSLSLSLAVGVTLTSRGRSCANLNKRYLTVTVEVVRPSARPSASASLLPLAGRKLGRGEKGKWREVFYGECLGESESRYSDIPSQLVKPNHMISLFLIPIRGTTI